MRRATLVCGRQRIERRRHRSKAEGRGVPRQFTNSEFARVAMHRDIATKIASLVNNLVESSLDHCAGRVRHEVKPNALSDQPLECCLGVITPRSGAVSVRSRIYLAEGWRRRC